MGSIELNMKRTSLYFTTEREVEARQEDLPKLQVGEVLVETRYSAISSGTEMLLYRGEMPQALQADSSIAALQGKMTYPLKYGYSAVGEVVELGKDVDKGWQGRKVFAFNPHESYFIAEPDHLQVLPDGVELQDAIFLPNVETAVNFVMDGNPRLAEQAVVLGQGIVGLLTTALLAHHPLAKLLTFDRYENRRQLSLDLGAHHSFEPGDEKALEDAKEILSNNVEYSNADLVYELSGAPQALDLAIELAGFDSRVVVGSWYGEKRAPIDLGGRFHRNRIQLVSSQVSTLTSALQGRWNKARRFKTAWEMLRRIQPSRFITQRFLIADAAQAYKLLDEKPAETVQVVFEYE